MASFGAVSCNVNAFLTFENGESLYCSESDWKDFEHAISHHSCGIARNIKRQ